jgi:hypothetical protein
LVDRLMMERMAALWTSGPHGLGRPTTRDQFDFVERVAMIGHLDVLNQSAAEGDVHDLESATDRQYRKTPVEGGTDEREFGRVVPSVDPVQLVGGGSLAVARRVDVAAAVQNDGIDPAHGGPDPIG